MVRKMFKTWAHIALLAANIIYGVNYSIAKAVMPDQIKPLALVALRSISAAGLFWITSLFLPKEKVSRKDLFYLLAAHFLELLLTRFFFSSGLIIPLR
ncbi:MAG: hypothetical protein IPN67_15005 [Bacteroidales bacterium]|nr:hypothetical protein [Bacteroidales bacterium]